MSNNSRKPTEPAAALTYDFQMEVIAGLIASGLRGTTTTTGTGTIPPLGD